MQNIMFDLTGKNWIHLNNNKRLKEKFETILGKHSIDSVHNKDVLGAMIMIMMMTIMIIIIIMWVVKT
jgi:transposase